MCSWVGARVSTSASFIHLIEGKALGGISEEAVLVLGRFIAPFNNARPGAGELAQPVRALAVLEEDLGSFPSTYMEAHNHPQF